MLVAYLSFFFSCTDFQPRVWTSCGLRIHIGTQFPGNATWTQKQSGRAVQSSRQKTTWQLAQADDRNRPQRRDEDVLSTETCLPLATPWPTVCLPRETHLHLAPARRFIFKKAVVIKNMSFKAGQTMTITGMVNPNATNFAINIGHEQDIALHVNPRFDAHGDQRTVVCNSYQGGKWCEEVRDSSFPFQLGKEFKVIITFNAQEFQVSLPDGSVVRFPNRLGDTKYRHMKFEGDTRIQAIEIK